MICAFNKPLTKIFFPDTVLFQNKNFISRCHGRSVDFHITIKSLFFGSLYVDQGYINVTTVLCVNSLCSDILKDFLKTFL